MSGNDRGQRKRCERRGQGYLRGDCRLCAPGSHKRAGHTGRHWQGGRRGGQQQAAAGYGGAAGAGAGAGAGQAYYGCPNPASAAMLASIGATAPDAATAAALMLDDAGLAALRETTAQNFNQQMWRNQFGNPRGSFRGQAGCVARPNPRALADVNAFLATQPTVRTHGAGGGAGGGGGGGHYAGKAYWPEGRRGRQNIVVDSVGGTLATLAPFLAAAGGGAGAAPGPYGPGGFMMDDQACAAAAALFDDEKKKGKKKGKKRGGTRRRRRRRRRTRRRRRSRRRR